MGDTIASGVFALTGALVGGLASYAATWAEARSRRRDAFDARRDALTQTRRTLYSTLVERADLLADASRRMWSYRRPTEIDEDDRAAYVTAWEDFVQARASVAIVGPRKAVEAGTEFSRSITDLCNYVDAWMNGDEQVPDEERYARLDGARAQCRKSFVDIAQDVLSTAV